MNYSNAIFGGVANVRRCMVNAVRAVREKHTLRPEDLDYVLELPPECPACADWEAKPGLMNTSLFCAINHKMTTSWISDSVSFDQLKSDIDTYLGCHPSFLALVLREWRVWQHASSLVPSHFPGSTDIYVVESSGLTKLMPLPWNCLSRQEYASRFVFTKVFREADIPAAS